MATELEYWKAVALWMADCHAATAMVFNDRKSASKSDQRRFRAISNSCWSLIRDGGGDISLARYMQNPEAQTNAVIDACAAGASGAKP